MPTVECNTSCVAASGSQLPGQPCVLGHLLHDHLCKSGQYTDVPQTSQILEYITWVTPSNTHTHIRLARVVSFYCSGLPLQLRRTCAVLAAGTPGKLSLAAPRRY